MENNVKTIYDLSVEEREEILVDIAGLLEDNAQEALIEGNKQFATLSSNMAEAIRINADELARDHLENTERVLIEAAAMIEQFNAAHPYKMVSHAIH